MSGMHRTFRGLAAAVAACLALCTAPAAALPFSGIYIFGDSLTDSGNAREAANTFDIFLPGIDDPAPPERGYFEGRFTNGYTYADLLSLAITGRPAATVFPYGFPLPLFGQIRFDEPQGNNLNFAYGDAQAIRGDDYVPGFKGQVDAYKALPGDADPNALYVVNFGGNDLFQVINDNYSPAETADYLADVAERIADQTARLESLGAQHILVTGAPDIGLVPFYDEPDDAIEAQVRASATSASLLLDSLLVAELAALETRGDFTADLAVFSYLDFIDGLFRDSTAFGLPAELNYREPCLTQRTPDASGRIDCTGFAFFDEIHPTADIHAAIYRAVSDQLLAPQSPVLSVAAIETPEPATLGLIGLGLIAVAMLRRQRLGKSRAHCSRPDDSRVSSLIA